MLATIFLPFFEKKEENFNDNKQKNMHIYKIHESKCKRRMKTIQQQKNNNNNKRNTFSGSSMNKKHNQTEKYEYECSNGHTKQNQWNMEHEICKVSNNQQQKQ